MSNMKEKIKDWCKNERWDGIISTVVGLALIMVMPVLILSVIVNGYEKNEAIRERHVQLWNTYKYKIRQYHGKNGHNVFYTNSYTVEGSGIRFTNEENKEMFIGGNYIIISTH